MDSPSPLGLVPLADLLAAAACRSWHAAALLAPCIGVTLAGVSDRRSEDADGRASSQAAPRPASPPPLCFALLSPCCRPEAVTRAHAADARRCWRLVDLCALKHLPQLQRLDGPLVDLKLFLPSHRTPATMIHPNSRSRSLCPCAARPCASCLHDRNRRTRTTVRRSDRGTDDTPRQLIGVLRSHIWA